MREVATAIARAADETIEAYRNARVSYEPSVTDRLMSAIESSVNALPISPRESERSRLAEIEEIRIRSVAGRERERVELPPRRRPLIWRAATLRAGSGSGAEEKEFGADILGVLSIDLPDYKVAKGFLAQAKRAEPGVRFSNSEWSRLRAQCNIMLMTTPDCFVVAYSKTVGFVSSLPKQSRHSTAGIFLTCTT